MELLASGSGLGGFCPACALPRNSRLATVEFVLGLMDLFGLIQEDHVHFPKSVVRIGLPD